MGRQVYTVNNVKNLSPSAELAGEGFLSLLQGAPEQRVPVLGRRQQVCDAVLPCGTLRGERYPTGAEGRRVVLS